MHEHLRDLGAMARVRQLGEAQLRVPTTRRSRRAAMTSTFP
jgi:hypothetical protein